MFSTSLVITMAGHGARLKSLFPSIPKPYVPVYGRPALLWSLSSFDLEIFSNLILISNKYVLNYLNPVEFLLNAGVQNLPISMVVLDDVPNGQAHSLKIGLLNSDVEDSFMVFNCDTYINRVDQSWILSIKDCQGAMGVFRSTSPNLSYAKIDEHGLVEETAEKQVISGWASSGLYWFRDTASFLELKLPKPEEAYIAPLYNQMIAKGQKIMGVPSETVYPIGTKDEIETFERFLETSEGQSLTGYR